MILNVGSVFMEARITQGQRVYETIREMNADFRPIALNEEDGRSIINFIETVIVREWRARVFLLAFSLLVFITTMCVIVFDHRERAKRKHNLALSADH